MASGEQMLGWLDLLSVRFVSRCFSLSAFSLLVVGFNDLEIVLHGFRTDRVCAGKCASVFFIPICEAWWCWAGFAIVHQFINLICMREFSPLVCSLAFW